MNPERRRSLPESLEEGFNCDNSKGTSIEIKKNKLLEAICNFINEVKSFFVYLWIHFIHTEIEKTNETKTAKNEEGVSIKTKGEVQGTDLSIKTDGATVGASLETEGDIYKPDLPIKTDSCTVGASLETEGETHKPDLSIKTESFTVGTSPETEEKVTVEILSDTDSNVGTSPETEEKAHETRSSIDNGGSLDLSPSLIEGSPVSSLSRSASPSYSTTPKQSCVCGTKSENHNLEVEKVNKTIAAGL